ncbi:hypothetical protein T484DRAFT_3643984 [Baffinella frigidus]|nr:hypothetical protein T484DRAFT_3643984 [Cryptophyta sp. CCMP2293]
MCITHLRVCTTHLRVCTTHLRVCTTHLRICTTRLRICTTHLRMCTTHLRVYTTLRLPAMGEHGDVCAQARFSRGRCRARAHGRDSRGRRESVRRWHD